MCDQSYTILTLLHPAVQWLGSCLCTGKICFHHRMSTIPRHSWQDIRLLIRNNMCSSYIPASTTTTKIGSQAFAFCIHVKLAMDNYNTFFSLQCHFKFSEIDVAWCEQSNTIYLFLFKRCRITFSFSLDVNEALLGKFISM